LWIGTGLGGWWFLALWLLAGHWATNPQYTYGWLVAPLALWFAWQRWATRPAPSQPSGWSIPLALLSALAVFPIWMIAQPNPGWRLVPALLALSAVLGTMALCARLGGESWAAHFAFPIFFMLTAVPWPGFIEETLVQGLMRFVAGVTVALLNFADLPAMQRGNLIEVPAGVLGVDEACSGVRSLQTALMSTLLFGELYRLKPGARFALVAAGFVAAVLTNIARTVFLSVSAGRGGLDAMGRWHDPAGYMVLTVCLVIIAIVAERLRVKHSAPVKTTPVPAAAQPLPAYLGILFTFWLVFVLAGTELWFSRPSTGETRKWTLAWPPGATVESLPATTLSLLGCDRTRAATWQDETGARWTAFFLEWFPRRSRTAVLAQVHRPEVCLPSTGFTEAGSRRTLRISAAGFDLVFESLHFRDSQGKDAFVFYCPWEIIPGETGRNAVFSDSTRTTSFRRVWQRERVIGQQVIELIVTAVSSREAAEASLRGQLGVLITDATGRN
jgi:exosortase